MDKSENNNLKELDIARIVNDTDIKRAFSWYLSPKTCYNLEDKFAREQIDSLCFKIKALEEEIKELKLKLKNI